LVKHALTDAAVRRLKPPSKGQVDHFDQGYPGLALRISYGGRRTWFFFNRWDGKLHRARLGTYPAMSLAEARDAWREAREKTDRGIDPSFRKPKDVNSTVEGIADEFLKRHVANLKPRTIEEYTRPVEKLIKPQWGHRAPKDITRADILALLDDVAEKSGPIAANRTLSLVRKFWNWAVERGIVDSSPAGAIKPYAKERSRDRVLTDDEIAHLWPALDEMGYPFGDFMKVLTLTAQRRQEVATMQWTDIDLSADPPTWTLPRSATKGDREHVVPLSEQVVAVLSDVPRFKANAYIFTTKPGRPISGFSKAKATVNRKALEAAQKAAKEDGEDPEAVTALPAWRMHDLRRTAASNMARMGFPPHVVAAVLNHSPGSTQGVTAIYNRYAYADEKAAALTAWARHVTSILEPSDENIVELRQGAD
jgi:integrase